MPISQWPTFINSDTNLENLMIRDLITPTKEWNRSLISTLMSTGMMPIPKDEVPN